VEQLGPILAKYGPLGLLLLVGVIVLLSGELTFKFPRRRK